MAEVYRATGQPQRALELYEQALPLMQEVGNRAWEATTLNNIALVYDATGQPKRALELYEQALPINREVGNRAMVATTLNNMAKTYRAIGQPQRALELYERALPILRDVVGRAEEARTFGNIAVIYQSMGQPTLALKMFEQALLLMQEVGDRIGGAATINNMAAVYRATGQPQRALELYEQALPLMQEVGNRAGEAATLANIANVLYQYLNRSQVAITTMEQAIVVLVETGLPQDAAGQTIDDYQHYLNAMRQGISPGQAISRPAIMPTVGIQQIVDKTISVMTSEQGRRTEWRKYIVNTLQRVRQQGTQRHNEADFFSAVLDILDSRTPTLTVNNPYAQAVLVIQNGIAKDKIQNKRMPDAKFGEKRKKRNNGKHRKK
jgi:tetratricopeptide (TPR) repeat protein